MGLTRVDQSGFVPLPYVAVMTWAVVQHSVNLLADRVFYANCRESLLGR